MNWAALVDKGKERVKSAIDTVKKEASIPDEHTHDVLSVELGVKGPPGPLSPGEELLARVRLIPNRYSLVATNEQSIGTQSLALRLYVYAERDFLERKPPFFQRECADISPLFHPLGVSRVEALFAVTEERAPAVLDAVLLNKGTGPSDACKASFRLRAAADPAGAFVLDCRAVLGGALYVQDPLDRPLPEGEAPPAAPPAADLADDAPAAPSPEPAAAVGPGEEAEERRAPAHERVGELLGQYASARSAAARADLLHQLLKVVEGVEADAAPGPPSVEREADVAAVGAAVRFVGERMRDALRAHAGGRRGHAVAVIRLEARLFFAGKRVLGEALDEAGRAAAVRGWLEESVEREYGRATAGERAAIEAGDAVQELARVLPEAERIADAAASLLVAALRGFGCGCGAPPDACGCTWAPAAALARLAALVERDGARSVRSLDLGTRFLAVRLGDLARTVRAASRGAARLDVRAVCGPLLEQWHEGQEAAYAAGVEEALAGEEWAPQPNSARASRSALEVAGLLEAGLEELAALEVPKSADDVLRAATAAHLLLREYAAAVTCSGLPPAAAEFASWRRPERFAAAMAEVRQDFAELGGDVQRALARVAARTAAAAAALSAPHPSPTGSRSPSPTAPEPAPAPSLAARLNPFFAAAGRRLPGPPAAGPEEAGASGVARAAAAALGPLAAVLQRVAGGGAPGVPPEQRAALRELAVRASSLAFLRDVPLARLREKLAAAAAPDALAPPPVPALPASPPATPERPPRPAPAASPGTPGRAGTPPLGEAGEGPLPEASPTRSARSRTPTPPPTPPPPPEAPEAAAGVLQALFDLSAGTQQAIERGLDALTDRIVALAVRHGMHEPLAASVEGGPAPRGAPSVAAWLVDRLEELDALLREACGEAARARLARALLRACAGHLQRLLEERGAAGGARAARALGDVAVLERFWRQAGLDREAVEAFFAPSRALLHAAARSR